MDPDSAFTLTLAALGALAFLAFAIEHSSGWRHVSIQSLPGIVIFYETSPLGRRRARILHLKNRTIGDDGVEIMTTLTDSASVPQPSLERIRHYLCGGFAPGQLERSESLLG